MRTMERRGKTYEKSENRGDRIPRLTFHKVEELRRIQRHSEDDFNGRVRIMDEPGVKTATAVVLPVLHFSPKIFQTDFPDSTLKSASDPHTSPSPCEF
jgi:hypothetical protein